MIVIDNDVVSVVENNEKESFHIGSPEAFKILSKAWVRSGWDLKYIYAFTWLGRPIIQFPEDMIRIQEVIYSVKPTVIIDMGVAHGGSLVFYASLLKAMGGGRVIGVDIEIRPHNRKAIEEHELFDQITLIESDSSKPETVEAVKALINEDDVVFVTLDSNHSKSHVLKELENYSTFVSKDSYIVAMDGIMEDLVNAPRSNPDWDWNNPKEAALEFAKSNKNFKIVEPKFPFNLYGSNSPKLAS